MAIDKRQIDMALLEQLSKLIDSSAMEHYKNPPYKIEPEEEENVLIVGEAGSKPEVDANPNNDGDEENDDPDEALMKLRKLAHDKEKVSKGN